MHVGDWWRRAAVTMVKLWRADILLCKFEIVEFTLLVAMCCLLR
jgi:hypothetical protein